MSVYPRKHNNGRSWMIDFLYDDPVTGCHQRYRRIAKGVTTKRQASALERELREKLETPPLSPEEQDKNATFVDFVDHWKKTRGADFKPTTYRGYEQILRVHLVPWFDHTVVRAISIEEVQRYKTAKLRSDDHPGRSPKTVNNHLGVLSSMFEDAIRWRYATFNPTRSVRKCRTDRTPDQFAFWTREESEPFLDAIHTERPRWYPLFLTALRTGMRLGELAALRWEEVDLERDRINVRRSYSHGVETLPKSGRNRSLPLSPQLRLTLVEHKLATGSGERVFLSDDGRLLDHNRIKHHFWCGIRESGVKRIRFHDLRHSFASQLVIAGVSLYKVQKLLGHQDIKTTMRYAHLSPEAKADAVLLLDGPSVRTAARLRHAERHTL